MPANESVLSDECLVVVHGACIFSNTDGGSCSILHCPSQRDTNRYETY